METRNLSPSGNEDNEDRISDLPDNLIHHILSFLDIKYAIETSVLSRRWRHLWKSLSTLNIDDSLYSWPRPLQLEFTKEEVNGFVDFVDLVLGLRQSSDIHRFNLACDWVDRDLIDCHINRWILAAVKHNVQELRLFKGIFFHTFHIPHCLFSCKSLTELELKIRSYEDKVVLPSSISLPRLKSLRIESLPFDDERLTNMLFSSCPVLESLILEHCEFRNVNLNISSSTLKHFKLFCSVKDWDGKVNLYAPNLTSFICEDFLSKDYTLGNLSSLVTADITLLVKESDQVPRESELLTERKQVYAQHVVKFLRALHSVRVLKLSPWILEVVLKAPEILDNRPTQFFNLQSLKLRTFRSRDCMDSIMYLLYINPNIVSLSLRIEKKYYTEPPIYPSCDEINFDIGNTDDYWEAGLLSPCMLFHLKFIEIRGLLGCFVELKFLEILLKNAWILEKVVLFSSTYRQDRRDRDRRMMKFRDKLLSITRASASTEILFRF